MRLSFTSLSAPWVVTFSLVSFTVSAAGSDLRLVQAVQTQSKSVARDLLRQGVDVNGRQGDGVTALHWASHWNDVETADLLIRAGADVNVVDDHGVTPLSLACTNGSAAMAERLLKSGANPNASLSTGETPLMTAARTGSVDLVRVLVAHGADVQAKETEGGQTALMWAAAKRHRAVAQFLVQHGADVHSRSAGGFTALLFAAQQGAVDIAEVLVSAGANVNDTAPDGSSALLIAADSAHKFVVTDEGVHAAVAIWLLNNGADPNASGAGRVPLHSAVQAAEPDLVKALLAHGADVNARLTKPLPQLGRQLGNPFRTDTIGATAFWLAAKLADVPMMRILIESGADPRLVTNDKSTALMAAAGLLYSEDQDRFGRRYFGDVTVLRRAALDASKLAVNLGDDVNAVNTAGLTALHTSVLVGGTELPQFLIETGAQMNARDKQGRTPLMLADGVYNGASFKTHPEVAALLRKLGADEFVAPGDTPR